MSSVVHRADHVGSLLRPAVLRQAHEGRAAGTLSAAELEAIEDRCIVEAIAMQESVGMPIVTDGEFRRLIYFGHFTTQVTGFTMMESEHAFDERGRQIRYTSPAVTGRLRRATGIATNELRFLAPRTGGVPKVTLPSPADQHMFRFREGVSDRIYPVLADFYADVIAVYREELAELGRLGAQYVQLDDTTFTLFCDPKWRVRVEARGHRPDDLIGDYIGLINACIDERPAGMTIGFHMCRGNNQGAWLFDGGYEAVAERVFAELNVDRYLLEYDSARAGGFEPLRFVPRDRFVVLGLITSKSPALESESEVLGRIAAAGRHFPADRTGISPQCGFASTAPGNPLSADDQRRKLELVVSVARLAWG